MRTDSIHDPADDLLIRYAEAISILGSAPAQRLIAFTSSRTALFCASPRCNGSPRKTRDGWHCDRCRKPWPMEEADWAKNMFGRVRPRSCRAQTGETPMRIRAADARLVLETVYRRAPWPFRTWVVHVLSSGPVMPPGTVPVLGIPLEEVPARLRELVTQEVLECPDQAITLARVEHWIGVARREAMREAGRRRRVGERTMGDYNLAVAEVAVRLAVSERHVRRLIDSGELHAIDVSAAGERPVYRVAEEDLSVFIERRAGQRPEQT